MRSQMKLVFYLASSVILFSQTLLAEQVDNSKVNVRDDKVGELTADEQGTTNTDVELTRRIRRSITSDASLSTYAHNIKIITRDGKVTLKGPVKSDVEKERIERLAKGIAGDANVRVEIGVAH